MGKQYDNSNSGAIWKNDDRKSERHPHYKGNASATCSSCGAETEYWASAWRQDEGASENAPVLKLKFTAKEEKQETPSREPGGDDDLNDDIPF